MQQNSTAPAKQVIQIPLKQESSTYKMIIPLEVERKIRYMCQRISSIEWSGVLFYTYNGLFEDGSLVITCADFFPMDIGTARFTEFDMSPEVVGYMTLHPELLDMQMGLIH